MYQYKSIINLYHIFRPISHPYNYNFVYSEMSLKLILHFLIIFKNISFIPSLFSYKAITMSAQQYLYLFKYENCYSR